MCIAKRLTAIMTVVALAAWAVPTVLGADAASQPAGGSAAAAPAQPSEPIATRTQVKEEPKTEEAPFPVSFSLTYALYSDYVWRGANLSEYPGEGREKPNHQLTTSLSFDLAALKMGDWGTIGFDTWYEWYAAQKQLDPDKGGQNLQEYDFTIWWKHAIEPIKTDVTLSYIFYNFKNSANRLRKDPDPGTHNDDKSQEWNIKFDHNDAWMWKWLFPKNEEGILNPSFFFAQDIGSMPGEWMEWGLSHDFTIPGVDNLTITPSYKLAAQCDYWRHGTFLAGNEWALNTTYDLTPILKLPKWAGKLTIGGEIHYWQPFGQMREPPSPNYHVETEEKDIFWGGMTVNWSWGG